MDNMTTRNKSCCIITFLWLELFAIVAVGESVWEYKETSANERFIVGRDVHKSVASCYPPQRGPRNPLVYYTGIADMDSLSLYRHHKELLLRSVDVAEDAILLY